MDKTWKEEYVASNYSAESLYSSSHSPRDRLDFSIAIVCALEVESTAVEFMFDEIYDSSFYGKCTGDVNAYTLGRINKHHAVLVYLPNMGKASSAAATACLRISFYNIQLTLLVGICGGIPHLHHGNIQRQMFLGDVVIGTAVVQYDYGRQHGNNLMTRKNTLHDNLGRPSVELRSFLHKMQAGFTRRRVQQEILRNIWNSSNKPDPAEDVLYPPDYFHCHRPPLECIECQLSPESSCSIARNSDCQELGCELTQATTRERKRLLSLHFGSIASGDRVIKSGKFRDDIAAKENVIAFEMEGAGLWDLGPTLVVKSVCDYADSHKNKRWQKYAALVGAAAAKALLSQWPSSNGHKPHFVVPSLLSPTSLNPSVPPRTPQDNHFNPFTRLKDVTCQKLVNIPLDKFHQRIKYLLKHRNLLANPDEDNNLQADLLQQAVIFECMDETQASTACSISLALIRSACAQRAEMLPGYFSRLKGDDTTERNEFQTLLLRLKREITRDAMLQGLIQRHARRQAQIEDEQSNEYQAISNLHEEFWTDEDVRLMGFQRISSTVDPERVIHPEIQKLRPSYRWRSGKWFTPGRMFAIICYDTTRTARKTKRMFNITDELIRPRNDDMYPATSLFGEASYTATVFTYVRRMIVVRNGRGSCLCAPVGTFSGRGLTVEEASRYANRHAILYDNSNRRIHFIPGEPRSNKKPIAITLSKNTTLDPASRVNLEDLSEVDWDLKVKHEGDISQWCLRGFIQYVMEENPNSEQGLHLNSCES